jgi:hypothetical protein
LMRIRNSGSGMEKFGSGINIPDPQHCWQVFINQCIWGLFHTEALHKEQTKEKSRKREKERYFNTKT